MSPQVGAMDEAFVSYRSRKRNSVSCTFIEPLIVSNEEDFGIIERIDRDNGVIFDAPDLEIRFASGVA